MSEINIYSSWNQIYPNCLIANPNAKANHNFHNHISKKRVLNLVNNAKYLFPELTDHHDEWLGFRPTLPDFLPVIGPSKNYKNLFYSFGHHHLGWTLGAISGKIIAGMIAGENTNLNLSPYKSLRFS